MPSATPLLIVIAGPARGRTVPLEGPVSIGRDEQCALAIPDLALSRRHCELAPGDAGVVLRDLGSRNGCFVNGRPVTTHVLADGDQIRIGDSALLFTGPGSAGAPPQRPPAPELDDTPVPDAATVAIPADDTRYCRLERGDLPLPEAGRASRDLAVLLRLSDALQRTPSRDAVCTAIVAHASDAVPADWVAVLTSGEPGGVHVAASSAHCEAPLTISRTIATRAMNDRVAVMANDLHADSRFAEAASVAGSPDRAVICAPLLAPDHVAGALYLARSTKVPFSEDDLHLVAGVGSIGGLALDRLRHLEWLEGENERLRRDIAIDHDLIGETPAMQAVYRFIARAAPTEATVLIRGESGTGKELVARAIHANSPRARGPFVAINCAALPEALLESELFGHERGAFTGAVAQQRGRLEMADRGTVFFDEIGELAPTLQAKLLRVLQDRTVERIGGRRPVPLDVRVIAASNRDLETAIKAGTFRQDLYYRLNVVSIEMPPLRERRDDLPLLAAFFVRKHAARCKRSVKGIAPDARALLLQHDWPGNVRELENAIERAVVLGSTDVILAEDLPEALLEQPAGDAPGDGFHARVMAHKQAIIRETLERSGGNRAQAARLLRLQPTYLHRLIRNLEITDK